MADEKAGPTERTPKGFEVPVPNREDFFGNLKRAAEPEKPAEKPSSGS
jgi:hypothetical protein